MIDGWTAALEATSLAAGLRNSVWAYPLVNAGHIFGIALLVGSIVPLDLRLLGLWESVPLPFLWRVLTRTAAAGFALAVVCGFLLFITRAAAYVESEIFIAKMLVVGAGALNAFLLHAGMNDHIARAAPTGLKPPTRIRLAALFSLAAWLSALTLGRLVGYF